MNTTVNPLGQPISYPVPRWTPPPWPPKDVMQGRYCRLEPLDVERHAAALFAAFAEDVDGRWWTYLLNGPFAELAGFEHWLRTSCLGNDPQFYTIIDVPTNQPVGHAAYLRIAPASGSIEVGHLHYAPCLQRRPAATEAMFLMMQWAFEAGYRRYEWKCDALNAPSRAAAQRLGLSFEGIFRQATVYKGRNRDSAWYAAIDAEWPALRQAFLTWLDLANFDPQGQQKTRLSDLTRPILKS